MKWHEDDDDYFMFNIPPRRAINQLAIYATKVAMGQNLSFKQLRLHTIKDYVNAVARMTACHTKRDPRKDNPLDQHVGKKLADVYAEIKRWENVPNRREAFTPELLKRAYGMAKDAQLDSLDDVLPDFRSTENGVARVVWRGCARTCVVHRSPIPRTPTGRRKALCRTEGRKSRPDLLRRQGALLDDFRHHQAGTLSVFQSRRETRD